jgi:hypothetical protein
MPSANVQVNFGCACHSAVGADHIAFACPVCAASVVSIEGAWDLPPPSPPWTVLISCEHCLAVFKVVEVQPTLTGAEIVNAAEAEVPDYLFSW